MIAIVFFSSIVLMVIGIFILYNLECYPISLGKIRFSSDSIFYSLTLGFLLGTAIFILIMHLCFLCGKTEYVYDYKVMDVEMYDSGEDICYLEKDSLGVTLVELDDVMVLRDSVKVGSYLIQRSEVFSDSLFWGFSNKTLESNILILGKGVDLKRIKK